jgi:hypothetical protein
MLAFVSYAAQNPVGFQDPDGRDPQRAHFTIIDWNSGLSSEQLEAVQADVQRALDATTRGSKDPVISAGVVVSTDDWIGASARLKAPSDIKVYLVGGVSDANKRAAVVRQILTLESHDRTNIKSHIDDLTKLITSDLAEQVDPQTKNVSGENIHDPLSDVSFVNVDFTEGRKPENLRVIAANAIHEGIGHRAISAASGETYHNPRGRGVMSDTFTGKASESDLLFEPDEVRKVQDFIKKVANDPAWFDH